MGNYRGPVAFGFEPADAFWTNKNVFEKYVISTFKSTDAYDEDYSVYEGMGFDLADHRDTAGCYGKADSVEDFVVENLDLSTCPETTILDAYINEDEARLVVKVLSSEEDIAEIKHWELTPYETMDFERVDSVGDDTYEIIFKIGGLNRTHGESYDEGKHKAENSLNESNKLKESARARLSVELRQFVARFVQNMPNYVSSKQDYDDYMNELAELAIREARWVGFPVEALKQLNFILSDDCLCCDMWDLVNAIIGLENRKKKES